LRLFCDFFATKLRQNNFQFRPLRTYFILHPITPAPSPVTRFLSCGASFGVDNSLLPAIIVSEVPIRQEILSNGVNFMANNIGINAVKKVIQELVVPELQTIKDDLKDVKGDVKGLQVEINRLDGKIDSLHNEMNTRFESVDRRFEAMDEKIDSLHNEMNIRFEATDEKIEDKIESRDRLAALESKVATLAAQINSR